MTTRNEARQWAEESIDAPQDIPKAVKAVRALDEVLRRTPEQSEVHIELLALKLRIGRDVFGLDTGDQEVDNRPARDPFVGFVNGRPTYDYGPGYEGLGGAKR